METNCTCDLIGQTPDCGKNIWLSNYKHPSYYVVPNGMPQMQATSWFQLWCKLCHINWWDWDANCISSTDTKWFPELGYFYRKLNCTESHIRVLARIFDIMAGWVWPYQFNGMAHFPLLGQRLPTLCFMSLKIPETYMPTQKILFLNEKIWLIPQLLTCCIVVSCSCPIITENAFFASLFFYGQFWDSTHERYEAGKLMTTALDISS